MENLQNIISKLEQQNKNNEDKCLDLKNLTFVSESGVSRLEDSDNLSYYFKRDIKKPKNPKATHALRQYCKIIGVPFSFFHKNSSEMKNRIAMTWLNSLKAEKSTVLVKLRRSLNDYIIRAVLPVEFSNISNLDVLKLISEAIGDDFHVLFSIGDEQDDLVLNIRFISKETFDVVDEKFSYGFSVIASELGASSMFIDTFLYHNESDAALIANYGQEPFFSCNYDQIQPDDLKALFPSLIKRLKEQLPQIKEFIQSAKDADTETKDDIYTILKDLRLKKGLSERFHALLSQEISNDNDIRNRWDIANRMGVIAKEFDIMKRMKIETVVGNIMGLNFAKT